MRKINPNSAFYIKLGSGGDHEHECIKVNNLFSPIANERYLVQIKSRASRKQFEQFQEKTGGMEAFSRYYFVAHSPASNLIKALETEAYKLWLPVEIASLVIQYGLVDWVIEKAT